MIFKVLKEMRKPKNNFGSLIETAIRLGILYLSGGGGSVYQMVNFVRSGTGLPSSGEDIDYFAKEVAKGTNKSKKEIKNAVIDAEIAERRHIQQAFDPERWVIEDEWQAIPYQEQDVSVLGKPKSLLSGLPIPTKWKIGIMGLTVGGLIYWLIHTAEKEAKERYHWK